MKLLKLCDLDIFKDNSYVSIGFFDGVHICHRRIINAVVNISKSNNCKSVIITFDESLVTLFKMQEPLMNINDKIGVFSSLDIDYVLVLTKSDNFMDVSAMEFKNDILDKLNCKGIVCGKDLTFAKNREGNVEFIKNNTSYDINIVEDVYYAGEKVSSTLIRKLIKEGNLDIVNKMLHN